MSPTNSARPEAPPRNFVSVVSLGCPKNQVDTENMLAALVGRDVVLCPDPADASVIIINTCGFIEPAQEESAEAIDECSEYRRSRSCSMLAVVGCWVERDEAGMKVRFPEVDCWLGVLSPDRVEWLVGQVLDEPGGGHDRPGPCRALDGEGERIRLTPPHWAYLRIADGCDNRCAYCSIPDIRGKLRSKPHQPVIEEAQLLAAEGVKEINLIAQDITAYGHDVDGHTHLPELIGDMARIGGIEWIRLLYTHPAHFTDELIDLIAGEPKVCNYVDIPIQHISDRILKLMGRGVDRAGVERLVAELRERVPGIVLRTTVIAGFPGETEEEFAELCGFLRDVRFERLGCFAYCPEPGTPAANFPGHLPDSVRDERASAVMELQQEIAFDLARGLVGRELPVIIDAAGEQTGRFIGRTYGDAPDVDPVIILTGETQVGSIIRAAVTGTDGYDLLGEL